MRFASFLSGGFITAIVVNPPERKLAKRTSVRCLENLTGRCLVFFNYSGRNFADGIGKLEKLFIRSDRKGNFIGIPGGII